MNKTSIIISVIMMVAFAIMYIPGVLVANRGKILRNIALWLAIFTSLALIYKDYGPGSPHPLFGLPAGIIRNNPMDDTIPSNPVTTEAKPAEDKTTGSEGYTPPPE